MASLSVNLTTMLVMTTIFISKMEGLPPTSDIKMIDVWLVLCRMVPFVEVILLTAMEYNREEKKEGRNAKRKQKKNANKLKTTSLNVIPLEGNELIDLPKIRGNILNCTLPSLKTLGKFVSDS